MLKYKLNCLSSLLRCMRLLSYVLCLLLGVGAVQAQTIPSFDRVQQRYSSSDRYVLDQQEQLLQVVRVDWQSRRGQWLTLSQISPSLTAALLQAEDRRFYEHAGVDWFAVLGTSWFALWGQRLRGTSTLSMQLVDLLGLGAGRSARQRELLAKWQQMRLAQQLENQWTKAQILEAYLNLVPFRGELVGVDAMSKVLWQKQAIGLTLAESSLAVAMLPSPNTSAKRLQQRSCILWRSLQPEADCMTRLWHTQQALSRLSQPAWGNPQLAPHAAQLVLQQDQTNKAQVVSTLDRVTQRQAQRILHKHLVDLKPLNVRDAALVVLHNESGKVVAYVGGSAHSDAAQVDHVQALRQAGSTLKPFLYQLALAQQRITAVSLLADEPVEFPTPYGLYIPQNYDEQFMGWVSVRLALAGSLNIPAVRVLAQVGVERFQRYLEQLGLQLPYEAEHYGLGLALGGVEVSLWQLTNAYRSLANLGQYSRACIAPSCQSSAEQIASQAATWLVQDILADNTARALTFGLDSALATPFWTAVKTGTSKDMRDNWALGFSQTYTVGVWVGNTDGSAMHEVSGVTGAAPIWHELMLFLHQSLPSRSPALPKQVICQMVEFQPAIEATRHECFAQGTERSVVQLQEDLANTQTIRAPLSQTIYALDPDRALTQQKIKFLASVDDSHAVYWRVNGVVVSNHVLFYWLPIRGKHRIELFRQKNNLLLDTVDIEVRG